MPTKGKSITMAQSGTKVRQKTRKMRVILSPAVKLSQEKIKKIREAIHAASLEGSAGAKAIKSANFIITGPTGTRDKKRSGASGNAANICRESGKPYGK